ncbi:hypothetical protein AERO9A_110032 [Aeromonas salmonicida]|nr:hypothetical protein AERO9A_110032 [Aeromonas salmonicida]
MITDPKSAHKGRVPTGSACIQGVRPPGPEAGAGANSMILRWIGKDLIKVEVIAAIRSYNRRHENDSDGFDGHADGGPVRAALHQSGMGGTHTFCRHSDRPVSGQCDNDPGRHGAVALLVYR